MLTLVEFIRQLLERQAIRRMDAGTLTAEETESIGLALMRLEETIRDIGAAFDLAPRISISIWDRWESWCRQWLSTETDD